MKKLITLFFATLALAAAAGCGDRLIPCDPAELPDSRVTLSPESVSAGTEVKVVASFDQPLFDPRFALPFQDVVIVDAATDEWIGTFSDDRLDYEWSNGPYVSGVVLDGEVIDEFSIELTIDLPTELVDGAIVELSASNQDPHCYAGVSGEAPLTVESAQ